MHNKSSEVPEASPADSSSPESRRVGFMAGQGNVGPEFFDPLPEDELRLWNCEDDEPNDRA
jgi:hypothetical protein